MNDSYYTIMKNAETLETIQKSKFISQVFYIESEKEAIEIINQTKKKHYKATHNVYSYIIGKNKEIQKSTDDGEPSGTAGVPILEVIKKRDLTNILIIVTRYFGGIKLGTGGLTRAYSHMAKEGIENSTIGKYVKSEKFKITLEYTHLSKIENEFNKKKFKNINIEYLEKVNLYFYLQEHQVKEFHSIIQNITNGGGEIHSLGKSYILRTVI